jgi:zeaxanthin glucosyltransferase
MGSILIAIMPGERGHYNCAFGMARGLESAGHDVSFIGIRDDAEYVAKNGFRFREIGTTLWPAGSANMLKASPEPMDSRQRRKRTVAALRAALDGAAKIVDAAPESQELEALFECDLFVADYRAHWIALLALHFKRKCIFLATGLPDAVNYPPPSTSLVPTGSFRSAVQVRLKRLASSFSLLPGLALLWIELKRRNISPGQVIQRLGIDPNLVARKFPLRLNLESLIASPLGFDFKLTSRRNGVFRNVEPWINSLQPIYKERESGPPSRLKIYVILGSHTVGAAGRVIDKFLLLARKRRDWDFIISGAAGRHCDLPNVNLFEYVNQMDCLQQADVMVTHCGMNSVKETIISGVPMVGIPLWRDQPSVSARIEQHNLGVIVRVADLDIEALEAAIDKAAYDHGIRSAVKEMQRSFLECLHHRPGINYITNTVRGEAVKRLDNKSCED